MAVCKPGDTVVFESPIYFNLLQLLKQQNLKIIEIPSSDTDGINLETLQFVLENNPVKAMFSISNFNNPMGFTMPSWKKKKLVKLLAGFDIPLIEDDIYGDIGFEQRPDICKSYDTSNNVILCSSFSKTIAPGIRIGWIVPGKHFDQIIKAKTLMNLATPSLYQIAVARFLKEGGYERHLRKLRKKLLEQVKLLRQCIFESFPPGTCVTNPDGGFLLWVELPQPVNTLSVYHEALEKKILIAPGELFSVKGKYTNCMRLNAGIWNKEVEAAIRYLGRLCYKQL
jgi:DNA-binding transcriptional MocR family regulator